MGRTNGGREGEDAQEGEGSMGKGRRAGREFGEELRAESKGVVREM